MSKIFKSYYNLTSITNTLHEDQHTFLIISRSVLLRMRKVSEKSCKENKNTHFTSNKVFLRKSCHLRDNVKKKYGRVGQTTDDNMAHAHFMLDTYRYKHTLRILFDFPLQQ